MSLFSDDFLNDTGTGNKQTTIGEYLEKAKNIENVFAFIQNNQYNLKKPDFTAFFNNFITKLKSQLHSPNQSNSQNNSILNYLEGLHSSIAENPIYTTMKQINFVLKAIDKNIVKRAFDETKNEILFTHFNHSSILHGHQGQGHGQRQREQQQPKINHNKICTYTQGKLFEDKLFEDKDESKYKNQHQSRLNELKNQTNQTKQSDKVIKLFP